METVSYEGTVYVNSFPQLPHLIHKQVPLTLPPNDHMTNPTISFHFTKATTIIFHPDSTVASQHVSQLHLWASHKPFSLQQPEWLFKNTTHAPA